MRSIIPAVAHWLRRVLDHPAICGACRLDLGRPSAGIALCRVWSGMTFFESSSRSIVLFEHDLFGKPVPTFPDHAQGRPLVSPGFPGCSGAGRSAPARPEPQHIHRPRNGNLRDPTATCCARIHRPPSIVPVIAKLPLIVASKPTSCNSPGRTYSHPAGARPQRSCRHIPCAICTPLLRASCHRRGPALQ